MKESMTPPLRGRGAKSIRGSSSTPESATKVDAPSRGIRSQTTRAKPAKSKSTSPPDNNNTKLTPRNPMEKRKPQSPRQSDMVSTIREEVDKSNARIHDSLTKAATLARQTPGPLSTLVILTLDAFLQQQELLQKLEDLTFPDVHEVRDDQVCIIQPKVRDTPQMQEEFVEALLKAADMETTSVVKIFRDRRKDFLIVRFSSKILVHEFLRRFRERALFKMLRGARLTRDMTPEELEKYWRSVEQVSALNKSQQGDRVFYVDLITLEVCQKETTADSGLQKLRASLSRSSASAEAETVSCRRSSYEGREALKVEYPKSEGNYYEEDGEISIMEREDIDAKRFNARKLEDSSSFINAQRRIAFDRMPKASETFDKVLLYFKEKRAWLHSVKKICYDANFVCHVDDLVRMAVTPAKDANYSWKIFVTKMENVIFMKAADYLGIDFGEKSQECNFKDAITLSRRNKSGLTHKMISTKIVEMPGCPMDILVFSDEDCVAREKRDGENAFLLLKTRPKENAFDEAFYRETAVEWYFRAVFGGIDDIVVGLCEKNNRIYSTRVLEREDLRRSDLSSWDPAVCLHFLNTVLLKIKSATDESADLRTLVVERRKGEWNVRVERDSEGHRFLPSSFVGAMLKKSS